MPWLWLRTAYSAKSFAQKALTSTNCLLFGRRTGKILNDNDYDNLHWRMKYNMENRGDVYATHGLGPVAQCMDIHRGDRFTTLVAMDTKSFVGKQYVEEPHRQGTKGIPQR